MECAGKGRSAEKISSLPDGLHTYFGKDVSEDGIMLSGWTDSEASSSKGAVSQPETVTFR